MGVFHEDYCGVSRLRRADGFCTGFHKHSQALASTRKQLQVSTLADYSTRIQSVGGATTGTGGLNMYASTIGLMPTVGVGIGTTVPSAAMLHIGSSGIVRLGPSGNMGNTSAALGAEVSRYQIGFSAYRDIGADQIGSKIVSINYNGWANANPLTNLTELAFFTTSQTSGAAGYVDTTTERLRITGSGNVGIGTTSPNSALTVAGNIAPSATTTYTLGSSSYVWGGTFTSWVSNMADTLTLYTAPTNGTISSYFNLVHNGSNYANLTQGKGPSIQFFAQGDILGGIYCLSNNTTTPNSAYYAITIRNSSGVNNNILYIVPTNATMANMYPGADAGGNLGIAGSRWSAVWAVNGAIQTSDSKEKDAVPLPYGLNEILQMRTIKYKWKSQADLPDDAPEKNYQYYGFCADELAPIFPELVYNEDPKVPVQMNYSEIMPVMVNAIKEQNATIVSLESKIAAQEARLAAAGL